MEIEFVEIGVFILFEKSLHELHLEIFYVDLVL
jgi:hypothetical protein